MIWIAAILAGLTLAALILAAIAFLVDFYKGGGMP